MISFALPRHRAAVVITASALAMLAPLCPVHADDFSLGGDGRSYGMAGAGLALPYGGGQRMNPASLGLEHSPLGLSVPSTTVLTDGFSADKISAAIANGDSTGAGDLLRQYVSSDRTIGLDAGLSVRITKFEISVNGVTEGLIQPNSAFTNWARTGNGDTSTLPENAKIDLIAAGYAAAGAAAGFTLPVPSDTEANYAVGFRAKYMVGAYSHFIANSTVLTNSGTSAATASEMNGNDYLNKTGIGGDLGFYRQPRGGQGLGEAVVVNNIVNPNITFQGTDRYGNPAQYKITATTINAGVGWVHGGTSLAVDYDDIGAATGKAELRIGGEERFFGSFAARAGYSSLTGYTVGIGLLGFGVAAGQHLPLELTKTLKF